MRKRRVVGRIYGMKYSWKGHKDRNRHKNRINGSGPVGLVYVKNVNRNIPTTWRLAHGDFSVVKSLSLLTRCLVIVGIYITAEECTTATTGIDYSVKTEASVTSSLSEKCCRKHVIWSTTSQQATTWRTILLTLCRSTARECKFYPCWNYRPTFYLVVFVMRGWVIWWIDYCFLKIPWAGAWF